MASRSYPPELASPALELPPSFWGPQPEWGWPPPRGPPEPSRGSPASSPESVAGSLSPAYGPLRPAAALQPCARGAGARAKGGRRGRLGAGQRQSASQREKLRMRRLARALHVLRRFLPPSVAPAGQSLTKIETLRLTIRYIGHLSDLLGLSPELLAWRGAARARRCPLCPPGLGCCQPDSPPLEPEPPAWPSPPYCLQQPPAAAGTDASTSSCSPGPGPGPATEALAWLSAPHCAVGAHVEDPAGSRATGAAAQPPQEDLAAQDLPAELLSFLETFLPPEAQD